ncbi:hypothetical protein K1T71_003382 [Dendrolimus kikuchii]|uniref:Uncharacterized protein n=1 Tax=Dendrolimus kikuchii TaxID=765133 RepID=A0ACC1DCY9_9NEOP|nr:hypothetical protein K1T71_003382 [Dendrolimus kikuchii]
MPQIFQVLRCFKCCVFQVHQTKKSIKFQCKMCGEKQSIKRHYGLGNPQECRLHVQKLNGIRSNSDEVNHKIDSELEVEIANNLKDPKLNSIKHPNQIKNSKWSAFIECEQTGQVNDITNETMNLDDSEVVLEIPRKCKKLANCKTKRTIDTPNMCQGIKADTSTHLELQTDLSNIFGHKVISECIHNKEPKVDHNEFDDDKTLKKSNKLVKNVIPLMVNTNSKWAKYSEELSHYCDTGNSSITKNVENINYIATQKEPLESHKVIPQNLFSLYEEENLDSLLQL